jgi:hypothetical protein
LGAFIPAVTNDIQAVEKRPSAAFPLSFVVAAYIQVRHRAGSPTRRRGKKSLLIRRDATLRISGVPASGISQGSTCICLPARSRFGEGRGIFDQPEKKRFFNRLISI